MRLPVDAGMAAQHYLAFIDGLCCAVPAVWRFAMCCIGMARSGGAEFARDDRPSASQAELIELSQMRMCRSPFLRNVEVVIALLFG